MKETYERNECEINQTDVIVNGLLKRVLRIMRDVCRT